MAIAWNSVTASLMPKWNFKIHDQVMTGFKSLKKGAIKEVTMRGRNHTIVVGRVEDGRTQMVSDSQTFAFGGNPPAEATYRTNMHWGAVEIGTQAHDETDSTTEGVQQLKAAVRSMVNAMGRQVGLNFVNAPLFTLTAGVSSGVTSFTVTDSTRFEPGAFFEVVRAGTVIETGLEVASRTVGAMGANKTITLAAATTAAWNSGDELRIMGSNAAAPKGLVDVCSSTTLYNVAGTVNNWQGLVVDASGGAFSKSAVEDLEDQRYDMSGVDAEYVLCGKKTARLIYREDKDLTGFGAARHDTRGKGPLGIDGMEVIVDRVYGDNELYLHSKESVALHTSLKLAPPGSSGKSSSTKLQHFETKAAYGIKYRTANAIRPEQRSADARYHGFAAA